VDERDREHAEDDEDDDDEEDDDEDEVEESRGVSDVIRFSSFSRASMSFVST